MVTDDAGSRPMRSPRPTGKHLPEKRKGFMIYLPPSLHAKLKLEAIKRAVSMSEVASTAVAQLLADDTAAGVTVIASTPEPFVGRFGGEHHTPKAADPVPESQPAAGPVTYEVE